MNELLKKLDGLGAETDDALGRFMNDEEMYLKYVRGFPEEPTMNSLRVAVAARDDAAAEKAAHTMKGIAYNLGFLPLGDAAMDMLEELRDGNAGAAMEDYREVEKQYRKFTEVIIEGR